MKDQGYYRDGYTKPVVLNAVPGLHQRVELELRPMLVEERDELQQFVQKNEPKKFNPVIRAAFARHVVKWDLTYDEATVTSKPVPITVEAMRRLAPKLFDRLYFVLMGADPGDLVVEPAEEQVNEYVASLLHGDQAEADAKN